MKYITSNRGYVAAIAAGIVLIASVAYADHSWGGYHWARTANPFTVKLGDNVSGAWDAHLAGAAADWSVSSVLDALVVPGKTNPKNCRAIAGRVEICDSKYGNNGWLGIAQVWVNGTHITQGTVKMNNTYFTTAKYNTPAWRRLVMCQEVGHAFGLDHQDEAFDNPNIGTCMDYTNDPSTNTMPNAHDYEQLEAIYAHLDATNTLAAGAVPPALAGIDLDNQSEWGRQVKGSANGKSSLYRRDAGNGQSIFTFVVWAD